MSYFLRELVPDDETVHAYPFPESKTADLYAEIIRRFHTVAQQDHPLRVPNSEPLDDNSFSTRFPTVAQDVSESLKVVGAPSAFATNAIAQNLIAKYGRLLNYHVDVGAAEAPEPPEEPAGGNTGKVEQLAAVGVSCVFEILRQLSKRDPDLCVQALASLLVMLQNMPADSLRNEPRSSLDSMMSVLRGLREEGGPSVSNRASSCLVALAVATGQPCYILSAVQSLLCVQRNDPCSADSNYDTIMMPDNLHKLTIKIQQKIYQHGDTGRCWAAAPLNEHRKLCSFDLPALPFDSPVDTPDDDARLHSAVACDGNYLYILNYIGLYKLGTGLQETAFGKLYASNNAIKATKNCMLTFCNSSLYLRRGLSSSISVLDIDSLRDIGEVILPSSAMQAALFSDGTTFYTATISSLSTLSLCTLNDSFVPSPDSKSRRKFRLTDVSFHAHGSTAPIPHELPLHLPSYLHNQAADLHLGREIAFLQSKTGKVFYAGNGSRFGLQETGTTWMELVLPEPIVQLSLGADRVIFRSGSGQAWVAGGEERRRNGKLRRLATFHRRKTISVCCSVGAYAYVAENGKVFMGGRHGMRVHPESGLVQGLEGVAIVAVYLGKTHCAAISKQGHLYTWGMNNLHQCGRQDTVAPSVSPRRDTGQPSSNCEPNEHLWVKDLPTICIQCGLCSARGASCPLGLPRGSTCNCGPGESSCLRCGLCRPCGELAAGTPHTPIRSVLPPARITMGTGNLDMKVASISCGNFHTVLLTADGRVFAFGSNCHGQLGCGDARSRHQPVQVILPADIKVAQVAAGANHSVLRTTDGAVYTFGAHKCGQLIRPAGEGVWNCTAGKVPGFGPSQPAFASWVGAFGDSTLIHSHKGTLTHEDIMDAQIVASKNDLFVFPRHIGIDYVCVKRKHGNFMHYQLGPEGLYTSWCLEPKYDVLWSYNAAEMRIHAHMPYVSNQEDKEGYDSLEDLSIMKTPEMLTPVEGAINYSSVQLGAHLLSSLFAVTTICRCSFWVDKTFSNNGLPSDNSSSEGFSVVSRFEGTGGGWGYSANSVEAVQFMASRDIKLMGLGLYGGRGEYIAKLKLYRLIGSDGDEASVEQLTESDETLFDSGPRETATLMFAQPISIKAKTWHIISAKISGPSSDCGASGKPTVECEDVTFTFRNSMISNNGTDVNVGQIPELYYQLENFNEDLDSGERISNDELDVALLFSQTSLEAITPELFQSMLSILEWTLQRVWDGAGARDERLWTVEQATYIGVLNVRLLIRYCMIAYPFESKEEKMPELSGCLAEIHQTMISLFQVANETIEEKTYIHNAILAESVRLFLNMGHAFCPSKSIIMAHLEHVIRNNVGDAHTASVLGALARRYNLLDLLLRGKHEDLYPCLSLQLSRQFSPPKPGQEQLTSLPNILRFVYDKAFSLPEDKVYGIQKICEDIIFQISETLTVPNVFNSLTPNLQQTPSRFRRRSANSAWDMSDGSPDAISFRVDTDDIVLHGIGIYLPFEQEPKRKWHCEVFSLVAEGIEQWETICTTMAELASAGGVDTGIIPLPVPVRLKSMQTYAVKIWAPDSGMKTLCGEGGVPHARLSNGAKLYYASCGLSENGTTLLRGQIPFLVYIVDSKKPDDPADEELILKSYMLLLRLLSNTIGSHLASGSLPPFTMNIISRISGHIVVFMERYPDKTIEVMSTLEQLIPMVSSLNGAMKASTLSESFDRDSEICESRAAQIIVESPHPYKSTTVHSLVARFDPSVEYMCVQFSSSCETAQADDHLLLYLGIGTSVYHPIGRYYGNKDWPKQSILLPGNTLWFVLETNAEVEGIGAQQMYGYHCTVTGYQDTKKGEGLRLEQELTWLSAVACRILVQLPSDPSELAHLSTAEDDTRLLLERHGTLLKKGLSLQHVPTLSELICKGQPQPAQTQDIIFLREFISAGVTTTPGFLAKWLPAGPVVDPSKCQLIVPQGEIVVGVPMTLRVITKDQYERTVLCPQMTVEVILSTGGSHSRKTSFTYTEVVVPTQETLIANPYQPVLINRGRYMSICAMPAYSDCSYEEIRLNSCMAQSIKDTLMLRHKKNSTFVADWVPQVPGSYRVECKVDGFDLSHTYTVTVVGKVDENRPKKRAALLSRAQLANIPPLSDFQGVRMRTAPSLTAAASGNIPRGASLSYIEEIENDDGRWLRLTDETAVLYGHSTPGDQVWCLAYHNHLRRELIPVGKSEEKKEILSAQRHEELPAASASSAMQNVVIDTQDVYIIEAGDTVPIYSRPSLEAVISDEEIIGKKEVFSDGWVSNSDGVWIRIQGTHRYILLEGSLGPSSIHSQSFSANGNEEDETSPPPRSHTGVFLTALRPSVADCSRAVFAAFLWHEHLVKDAMAAATYLKFHQHLHGIWSSGEHLPLGAIPPALQPIVRLWKEVCQAVIASVEQHLIMPPPVGKARGFSPKKNDINNCGCELCEDQFKVPVTVHMRMAHIGCGADSQGYGYNSNGKYTTGWSGDCGTGGRAGSTWYLLCPGCRNKYLKKTPAGHRQERTRRWREFRLSATASETRPEVIIKQNALFLLDLNSSLEYDSKNSSTSSGWTINLFPTQTPSPMNRSGIFKGKVDSSLAKSSFISQSWRGGHSDPGPKGRLISPPTAIPTSSLGGSRQPAVDEGTEVLQSPSAALRTLLSHSAPSTAAMLKRPVLAFIVEHHNLKRLRAACEQSIRRAAAFSHAFRVWNWLLRLVSSEGSVSDIIFQFLTALSSYHKLTDDVSTQQLKVLPHPWRLCFLAGPLAGKMVQHLHAFLYTVAVILQSSGVDAKLRSLCFRAWTIQLTAHEQELLILTCNILATVGGVLSDGSSSEHWAVDSTEKMNTTKIAAIDAVDVRELRDITSQAKIDASSRQAMVVCLTDGSSETFWESGEEDKNRSRLLTIKLDGEDTSPVLLAIFIDNVRDEGYKTTSISFRAAMTDGSRKELHSQMIEANYSGWLNCCIAGTTHIQIQLKGSNNALRVRQLLIQGFSPKGAVDAMRPSTSHQLFFNHTQMHAFTLFQAISAQAFGEELSDDQQGTLRERVVDLLCSRVQLQPLQNYVGQQVVHALEREVDSLCAQQKRNYSYVCGLMSMLVRISTGRKGTGELAASRNAILISTSQLVIFAPQVVQCQALDALETFLNVYSPESVDIGRFMRNMLIVVSKVISLQVRDKIAHSVTTATMNESVRNAPVSWRTDKSISPEIGRLTTQLLAKLSAGEISHEWAEGVRRELASSLLSIVQFSSTPESFASKESLNRETPSSFLSSKRFWLAVSALALVKDKSWLALAEQWSTLEAQRHEAPDTLCENHDDGHTAAQVYCTICDTSLCRECFTVMHLNKKNRSHHVQALAQPTRMADIDIHQGCARMRLQQLLILFHGDSLNGMVELSADPFTNIGAFAQQTTSTVSLVQLKHCRFCGNSLETPQELLNAVCAHEDCTQFLDVACDKVLPCGHYCGGIKGEESCLPCLTCHSDQNQQDGDDLCVICFTDRLGAAPAVRLACGHLFHFLCLRTVLEKRWNGPRINFRFLRCPLCNIELDHPGLSELLDPLHSLQQDVKNKALMRLEYDGLMTCQAVIDPNSEFHNKPADYAMDRYMYVLCSRCQKSYFGGESRCQQALNTSQYNPEDLVCGGCSDTTGAQVCGRHGVEYLEYKCRFCCSIAVYFCFGTTHFCASCHDDFQRLMCLPKTQLPHCPAGPRGMQLEDGPCPLKIEHPPTGEEFAMGCGICRNISTF